MKEIYRKDYTPPAFFIPETELTINLEKKSTTVSALLHVEANRGTTGGSFPPLELHKGPMEIISIEIDGKSVEESKIRVEEELLRIESFPAKGKLKIVVEISPLDNKALEGLYISGSIYCTQNEPEGFRRIIPFIDRPDNMTKITTTIIAHKEECPVLLSNGNLVEKGEVDERRHFARWQDPFPKPVYLYALVAGKLGIVEDTFTTKESRDVALEIYCDPGNEAKCYHAMESLKKAMSWDEERFNLSYDLDTYMIVAVDSFNMGAMENKGLNIFNSQYVLADEESATDANYLAIEGVIGHEYFHNWTGNRVTCRDWFQLTLKEGLTVFRDQEFTSDVQSRPVKRIDDVSALRTMQFQEDAGPMSHPIRPDSYIEINNFYTLTVYEKGAEVIRMIHSLLGEEEFMAGMEDYIQRFDGMAVTCDDFVESMERGSGEDLSLFRNWYSTPGTPVVTVQKEYNSDDGRLDITLTQNIPSDMEKNLHIPLKCAIIDGDGKSVVEEHIINLLEAKQTLSYSVPEESYISLNRNFSAPIILKSGNSLSEDLFLFRNDTDPFNRWDAGQRAFNYILDNMIIDNKTMEVPEELFSAIEYSMDTMDDPHYTSYLLTIPSMGVLIQKYPVIDIENVYEKRRYLKGEIAKGCYDRMEALTYTLNERLGGMTYKPNVEQSGLRELRLTLLSFLSSVDGKGVEMARNLFNESRNMTDRFGSMRLLAMNNLDVTRELDEFYSQWSENSLVLLKWFSLQVLVPDPSILDVVKHLERHEKFQKSVPNMVRSLYGSFTRNLRAFHHKSGSGYSFIGHIIEDLDRSNPSMASALSRSFSLYGRMGEERNTMMKKVMEDLQGVKLSKNTHEIISKTLAVVRK
jgi:aminopeptidase N